jgi:hypothetical protein
MTGRRSTAVALTLLVAAAGGMQPPAALADGDPASDVLVYQPVFFPYQQAPGALRRQLTGLVRSANEQGYRIRVAVIQSPRDLGSVPVLFGKPPAVYARFLSSELSSIWRQRVLVVMPSGYGLAQGAHLVRHGGVERIEENVRTGPDVDVLRRLPPPSGNTPAAVVQAASRAVRALAARHDIALTAAPPAATSSGGGSRRDTALAAAVAATVGLTAGLLWFLWRTRPRRPRRSA